LSLAERGKKKKGRRWVQWGGGRMQFIIISPLSMLPTKVGLREENKKLKKRREERKR